jgi:hypothetical protein
MNQARSFLTESHRARTPEHAHRTLNGSQDSTRQNGAAEPSDMPSPAHRATVLVRAEKQLRFDQPRPEEPPGGHTDLPLGVGDLRGPGLRS